MAGARTAEQVAVAHYRNHRSLGTPRLRAFWYAWIYWADLRRMR